MSGKKLDSAARLRRGQANLDRMKREIRETVATIVGAIEVRRVEFFTGDVQHLISAIGCSWIVQEDLGGVTIRCLSQGAGLYNNRIPEFYPSMEMLSRIHMSLVMLLDGVKQVHAGVAEILETIECEADYQFPD